MLHSLRTRSFRMALLAAVALVAPACKDSTGTEEKEPEIATMRLTSGTSVVNVSANGTVTGGPLVIARGTTPVTAQFLKADGSVESLVTAAEFRLTATNLPAGVTYTANGLGGTVTSSAAATGTVRFALLHIEEGHEDFGPFQVAITIP